MRARLMAVLVTVVVVGVVATTMSGQGERPMVPFFEPDLVYVADRTNNRVQVFRLDGTFVREAFIARNTLQNEGTAYAFGFSNDKEQRFLYVVDGSNKAIRVLNRSTLEQVSMVGGRAGHNAREFFHVHSFAVDSKGNMFIGEVNDGQRYYRYAFRGMRAAGQ